MATANRTCLILLISLSLFFLYVNCVPSSLGQRKETRKIINLNETFEYLIFRKDCLREFHHLNFFYSDCISMTLSKLIGYLIILMTVFNKIPQILKIYNSKSGKGIVAQMIYTDLLMNLNRMLYFMHTDMPFSTYGELLLMSVQNCMIVALLWKYNDQISSTEKISTLVFFVVYIAYFVHGNYVPEQAWLLLISTVTFLNFVSKGPQIAKNFREKSTGELSFPTYFMSFLRNLGRLFTVLKESSDLNILLACFISTGLNGAMVAQIF